VSAPNIADVVEDCGRKGVSTLVVLTAGFAETGAEGQQRQVYLLRTARTYGMRVVGPNCTGIINTDPDAPLNATFGPLMPPAGRVGMATQSAALGLAAVDFTSARNLGLSSLVSMGNKADISGNDLLGYWHTDPRTDAILLYLESFGNPRKFGRLARDIGRSKPIVALKSGRSSVGPRLSGLDAGGLLAASDISVDALFRQAGVIRTDTLQEMLDVAELLVHQPLPRGARVAILSNSSGPAIMCADTCEARGLEVAHAVDLTAAATAQDYADTLRTLTEDPNVDALISIFLPLLTTQAEDVAHALRAAAAELVAQKPVLAVFMSAHALPILTTAAGRLPGYQTPEAAAIALAHATTYALWRDRPPEEPPEFADLGSDAAALIIARALQRGAGWLGWDDVQRVLLLYGVETIDQGSASSRLEATVPGVEMLIGVVHDPQFGPTVACGAGGALAEVMNDVAIRLSPLTRNDAATMLRELRSFRLLEGYRGSTACDVSALEDVILRISAMVERHPEIAELDCNPVIVSAAGALVIDARIRVAPAPPVPPLGARRQ